MKRLLAGMAAALLAAVLVFPYRVQAISAQKAILMDCTTGRVLYEKDAHSQSLIASTTKIMTALVICEQCNVLDRIRIPKEAVGIEGSSMYLQEGEVLTIQDLLYGLMLHSGNDAAVALAIYCGGTVEGFAELMNDKAYQLGLENTHFVNPNGLDAPGHYSTAADMAALTAYAMNNPVFARTVATKTVHAGNRAMRNHNKLLWQIYGVDGVKTGYTKAAGRILVSSAVRDGRRLVAVTINAPNDWNDHAQLLNQGFSNYKICSIISEGQMIGFLTVIGGQEKQVGLIAADDFSYALMEDEMVSVVLQPQDFAYAPVIQGQSAGYAYICVEEQIVGKIPIVFSQNIETDISKNDSFFERLKGAVKCRNVCKN